MSEIITNNINMDKLSIAPSLKDNYVVGAKDGSTYKYNIGETEEEVNTAINACGITAFSTATAYSAGDYVEYNNWAYKFVNAHQGAWNAADASLITAIEEFIKMRKVFNTEKVNFNISYSDGSTGIEGIRCYIKYSDDSSISALTDASGNCSLITPLDTLYQPDVEDVSGYDKPTFGYYREITNVEKTLYVIYRKVELKTSTTMTINVSTDDASTAVNNTVVDVFFDTSTFRALTVVDGSVNCDAYVGDTGVIMCQPITGYVTPEGVNFTLSSTPYETSIVYDTSV